MKIKDEILRQFVENEISLGKYGRLNGGKDYNDYYRILAQALLAIFKNNYEKEKLTSKD